MEFKFKNWKSICLVMLVASAGLLPGTSGIAIAQTQTPPAPAADDIVVEVKGIGIERKDAEQDALRAAIGKAMGVTLRSETTVENFVVVQDAIATHSEGYITGFEVLSEGMEPAGYTVSIRAKVSSKPLKADAALLAKSLGGIRWMVAYDPSQVPKDEIPLYDQTVERMNEYLASRKYRYIERGRFEALRKEANNMAQEQAGQKDGETNTLTYAQQLGMLSGAQFILFIDKISASERTEAFDTRTASKMVISAKAFDNCTAEGLGTVLLEGDWQNAREPNEARRIGISTAVANQMPKLLEVVNSYIGDWVNNGTPYELRFYGTGGFRDLRDLRGKLQKDPLFGGQLEITAVQDYARLNGTFKRQPADMADRVLDLADEVPDLKAKRLDVKLIFGRQINFAPTGMVVPALQNLQPQPPNGSSPSQMINSKMPAIKKASKTKKVTKPTVKTK